MNHGEQGETQKYEELLIDRVLSSATQSSLNFNTRLLKEGIKRVSI